MSYNTEDTGRLQDTKLLAQKVAEKLKAVDTRIADIENVGGQVNVLEGIKVNGEEQTITDKKIDITVPTKVSDLTNDSQFQTQTEVSTAIQQAISSTGHASFVKVDAIPDVNEANDNVLYLVMNSTTGHYDIYAKVTGDNGAEVVLIDDTTVDLSNYVQKETGKGLSTNDYTTAEKEKLSGIKAGATKTTTSTTNGNIVIDGTETKVYEHPEHTAHANGLYKVTVDGLGHVTDAVNVTHSDLATLLNYTTDAETTEMLAEVFGS